MRFSFRERVIEPEWLDDVGRDEARNSLADIVRLNRYWGGYSSLATLLRRAALPPGPFSVLDIGAGNGDMGRQIRRRYPNARVTSLDYVAHHMDGAMQPKVVADAFHLPFAQKSFDYVFSSLFLHHFSNPQIVGLLAASATLARRAILVDDLHRAAIPYYFVPATRAWLRWDPITVHDGPISVAAGFRAGELVQLAASAGLRNAVARTHGIAYRVTLFAPVGGP